MASSADLKILGIIPARGGSKRLPRKNVLPLCGKPLIQWTIEAGRSSQCLTRLAVSSDDDEILSLARASSDVDAIERPSELASDVATSAAVVRHALQQYAAQGQTFGAVMLLQPTSPLRTGEDVRAAVELFVQTDAASVVSVSPVEHSPLWSATLPSDGSLDALIDQIAALPSTRSQDMPAYYRLNGAIYLARTEAFDRTHSLFNKPSKAYVMPVERSFDIDTRADYLACEAMIRESQE